MLHRNFILKYLALFLLLTASFAFGNFLSFAIHYYSAQETISNAVGNWGLSFQEEGKRPVGNASIEELQQYDAYYAPMKKIFISPLTADMKMAILKSF